MMYNVAGDILYQMPSAQKFLRLLTEDFAARRSVVILIPDGVDTALLWTQIESAFWQRSIWYQILSLSEMPHHTAPLMALAHEICGSSLSVPPRSISGLLEEVDSWPSVLVLSGIQRLAADHRVVWIRFINRWAEECQGLVSRGDIPPALCAILPVSSIEHGLPESNVQLAIHWYWGFPSALEMQLLCQFVEPPDEHHSSVARWRAHVIPALAGNDIALFARLWDCCTSRLDDLWSALQDFAAERGWTEDIVQSWQADELLVRRQQENVQGLASPPTALQRIWSCGALLWTPEYGLELHPAALAVLQRHDVLKHRIWRGQAKLLLPLLDQVRLKICENLTRSYGSEWPLRWSSPLSDNELHAVQESPLGCQWGHLERLLRDCPYLRAERRYITLTAYARKIRNEIAHYRPVNYSEFTQLAGEIKRLSIIH